MPQVHERIARHDLYFEGYRAKANNIQGYKLDRTKPANKKDKVMIKKGQKYYTWQRYKGPTEFSLTYPKPQQLTSSAFLISLYSIQDRLGKLGEMTGVEDFKSEVEDIISEIESLRDEQEEKKNNMPDSLQESDTGQMLQDRYDNLDTWKSELEGIDLDFDEEGENAENAEEQDTQRADWISEKATELQGCEFQG